MVIRARKSVLKHNVEGGKKLFTDPDPLLMTTQMKRDKLLPPRDASTVINMFFIIFGLDFEKLISRNNALPALCVIGYLAGIKKKRKPALS